jgi:molybdopterin synthase sulfur carrier subunit
VDLLSSRPPRERGTGGVTVRFWAAARQAAGHAEEATLAPTIGELRSQLSQREGLAKVIAVASFLVDGVRADDDTAIPTTCIVDVLPPFAGG